MELIQIVEDDPEQAGLLDHALRKARYRTNVASTGEMGLRDIQRLKPALILLDVMLPGLDGYEVCKRVREEPSLQGIPIIMITALGTPEHRVAGLELGADDYIAKPFSPREVVSRVKAVLRRAHLRGDSEERYLNGALVLKENRFIVSYQGQTVPLSGPEWWVLRCLADRPGEVITREELVSLLWGEDGLVHEHELYRSIQSLRRKLETDPTNPSLILTIPNVGYRLATPASRPIPSESPRSGL
jgi:DNA-binding response OmpR family regulator